MGCPSPAPATSRCALPSSAPTTCAPTWATSPRSFGTDGRRGLDGIHVQVGKPVRMALAERSSGAAEIIERMGIAAVEPKLDGFRCQVHKDGDDVRIYSRNLEETTAMLPDMHDGVAGPGAGRNCRLRGRSAGLRCRQRRVPALPGDVAAQAQVRHRPDDQSSFRCGSSALTFSTWTGKTSCRCPTPTAASCLRILWRPATCCRSTSSIVTGDPAVLDAFFAEKVSLGLEGIVAKRLDSTYQAGARNFNWIKLKRSYQGELSDSVDCVVVGYWRGRGRGRASALARC